MKNQGDNVPEIQPDMENKKTGKSGSFFWPLILIVAGFIFLLNNFNVIPWSAWENLLKFWPVLLILWGLEIFLGGGKVANLIVTFIGLLILLLVLGSYMPEFGNLPGIFIFPFDLGFLRR